MTTSLKAIRSYTLGNYILRQLNNTITSFFNWTDSCSFCWHYPWLFEREFHRSMGRKRKGKCVAPQFSWPYAFGLFSLGAVWKVTCTARKNALDEPKARITAAIANVAKARDSASCKRWNVDGVCAELLTALTVMWPVSATSPLVCKEKLFQLMNKTANNPLIYVFVAKLPLFEILKSLFILLPSVCDFFLVEW
jgi:hypothetical protein